MDYLRGSNGTLQNQAGTFEVLLNEQHTREYLVKLDGSKFRFLSCGHIGAGAGQ